MRLGRAQRQRGRHPLLAVLFVALLVSGWCTGTSAAAGSGWQASLVPWTTPGPSTQSLVAVACPAARTCVAVGNRTSVNPGSTDPNEPIVERDAGGTWRASVLPIPNGRLEAISCGSTKRCLAVGANGLGPLVEVYSGSTWRPTSVSGDVPALSGVACASNDHCVAVGGSVAATWNGTSWTISTLPGSDGNLLGISCPSTTWCVAIDGTAAFVLSHGHWQATKLRGGTAAAISCAAIGHCLAVGSSGGSDAAWTYAGSTWKLKRLSSGLGAGLSGVACATTSRCGAVGDRFVECGSPDGGCGTENGVVVSLDAGAWSTSELPYPELAGRASEGLPDAGAEGIACPSATTCVAVGFGSQGDESGTVGNSFGATYQQQSPTKWLAPTAPVVPGGPFSWLSGVSCSAASSCIAVGAFDTQSFLSKPLVAASSPTGWSAAALPLPSKATQGALSAVSCVPSLCVAVGWQQTDGSTSPLVDEFGKNGWVTVAVPEATGTQYDTLLGVACSSDSACTAVGEGQSSGLTLPVILTLADGTWSAMVPTTPDDANQATGLSGVWCSSTNCVATGLSTTGLAPIVETESGGSWQSSTLPTISGDVGPTLVGVGCSGAGNCLAVGDAYHGGVELPAQEAGPTSWTASVPDGSSASGRLLAAACTSSTTCIAAGSSGAQFLVMTDTSGAWSATTLPPPTGASNATLVAISCASTTSCTAVGQGAKSPVVEVDDSLGT